MASTGCGRSCTSCSCWRCLPSCSGLFSRPIPARSRQGRAGRRPAGSPGRATHRRPGGARAGEGRCARQPTETLLRDVVDAIEAAADDDRISSLYLDLGGLEGGGLAKLEEVAAAIDDFRATGKPVIAYGDYLRAEPVLPRGPRRRDLPRPDGRRVRGRLRELRALPEGRARQALHRREHLPRRAVQVGGRDLQPQRHVARGARGEPRLARRGVDDVQGRRGGGARVRARAPAGVRGRRGRETAQGRRRPGEDGAGRRARHLAQGPLRGRGPAGRRSPARTRTPIPTSAWTSIPTSRTSIPSRRWRRVPRRRSPSSWPPATSCRARRRRE